MSRTTLLALIALTLALAGCAIAPVGPAVMTLPGTGKSFDEFRADDAVCRQFANEQVNGLTPQQTATNTSVAGGAIGTGVGAAAGALIGGTASAAGIGAGAGLLLGGLVGAGYAQQSWWDTQRRYDVGYLQCMYAKGNKIPASSRFVSIETAPARQAYYPPPPPPNAPPPPPPTR